ncbi:hypothetical protein Goari_014704 [Gossypium aridum]|uniref:Uncharacterized protein n=1 Tax=Gossypium aridum TaxID=34290 RepID=A0A7J8XIM5_GOSAI|nr:hypothetical protein [Gossypium aridum]
MKVLRYLAEIDGLIERKNTLNTTGVLLTTKIVLNSNVSSSFAAEAYAGLHAVKLARRVDGEDFQTENRHVKEKMDRIALNGRNETAIKLKQMGQLDMKRRWK